ncbi:MAG: AmmeMemoRadiSam system protein B, partial [Candidatus Nanoarchaeia archaeon]
MPEWYPQDKERLQKDLDNYLSKGKEKQDVHGLIVPHAGYAFSGSIAGKAFSLLPKQDKAVVIGPSHYIGFQGIKTIHQDSLETPLGSIKIIRDDRFGYLPKGEIEHAIGNQIPFLQKLGFKAVLPLVIGEIDNNEAKQLADYLLKHYHLFIFSTDLSHFLPYEQARHQDKKSINIIENLDFTNWHKIDACGKYPLLILFYLCQKLNSKPVLIEYRNSGDITGDKDRVVGYASFY